MSDEGSDLVVTGATSLDVNRALALAGMYAHELRTERADLEQVFLRFYRSYDQYRTDLAGWQARYMSPSLVPAPMALQLPGQPQAQLPAGPAQAPDQAPSR